MANKKLSQLTSAGSVANTDIIPIVTASGTRKATAAQIKTYATTDIGNDIIPDTDVAYDLGSATKRFRDLYLSSTTIYLGPTSVSVNESGQLFLAEPIEGGEGIGGIAWIQWKPNSTLEIRTDDTSAFIAKFDALVNSDTLELIDGSTGNFPPSTILTVNGAVTKTNTTPGFYDFVIPVDTAGSDQFVYNFVLGKILGANTNSGGSTFSGSYNDLTNTPSIPATLSDLVNDMGFITSSVATNLVPTTDNTVDLGGPTNRFRHLYIAPGTIYLGNIKLTNLNGKLDAKKVINPGEDDEEEDPDDSDAASDFRSTRLENLIDVEIDSPTNGQALIWNAADQVWENGSAGGGGNANTGNVTFDGDKLDWPGGLSQDIRDNIQCSGGTDTVIYTPTNYRHSIRLFVQVEGSTSDGQWDTQACDIIAVKGFRGDIVKCSVFGVTHTSENPLATFDAQWNAEDDRIEITCSPTTSGPVYVSCHALEINTND